MNPFPNHSAISANIFEEQGFAAAQTFGHAFLLLDRYFLSVPALEKLKFCQHSSDIRMDIVTKAKSNVVAYERPAVQKPRRGRPAKKGAPVKLKNLFLARAADFLSTTVTLYGQEEEVPYLCLDLLWGQGWYQELRFVLVKRASQWAILVSTVLTLSAAEIITLYGYRFKIESESTFREMKQVIGAFGYHFWSKSMPKLNRYQKKGTPDPLEKIVNEQDQLRIHQTLRAIEGFVMCQCIAMGLLQLLALRFSSRIPLLSFRYFRTPSKTVVSEATVAVYLRKSIFYGFALLPQLPITKIIRSRQAIYNALNIYLQTNAKTINKPRNRKL